MKYLDVIIDIHSNRFNKIYTYLLPEHLEQDDIIGRRVLLEFGNQKLEAYVVGEKTDCEIEKLKSVIRVLDDKAVIDQQLLELAYWMADYYLCPVSVVLHMMVPAILQSKKNEILLPVLPEDEYSINKHEEENINMNLLRKLWESGGLKLTESLKTASIEEIDYMEKAGLIIRTGTYRVARDYKSAYVYIKNIFDYEKDLPLLKKRAPRQAQVMELLKENVEIDREYLDKKFNSQIIKALLKKDYIKIQREKSTINNKGPVLNSEQQKAVQILEKAIETGKNEEFLLFGVTGSGKTEVYLRSAQKAISRGKGVIILLPEIALTRQLLDVFSARIDRFAVLHSAMTTAERYDEWRRIKRGEVDLVIGPRSAVFAPLKNLGLIIIDEEQENTFKQEEMPRYHTREVARKRGQLSSGVLIYGSATPSLETFYEAMEGSIKLITLQKRVLEAQIPSVHIEDLRRSSKKNQIGAITDLLTAKIQEKLDCKEQIILFINRRGYSPMTICKDCGNITSCPFCSVSMTYHQDINRNVCHYCNYRSEPSGQCSRCGSTNIYKTGSGTQKTEEEVQNLFPEARIERLDLDKSRKKGAQKAILHRMKNREIDILIGTQMVAKGLDFPNVSLVGIIDADGMLNIPDFRAGERCFQLLVQAAGRAGRAQQAGEVLVQTFNPDVSIIQMAAKQDYLQFYLEEIKNRKLLDYPPFTKLLRLVISSTEEQLCINVSSSIAEYVNEITDASEEEFVLLGPAPCPINKLKNRFRYHLILKSHHELLLKSIAAYIINRRISNKNIKIEVDFNPMAIM